MALLSLSAIGRGEAAALGTDNVSTAADNRRADSSNSEIQSWHSVLSMPLLDHATVSESTDILTVQLFASGQCWW
jgi:hypothetical protein